MESIPWPQFSVAAGGWLIAFTLLMGLLSGRWFVSRREADIYLQRAEKAETNVELLTKQNSELVAFAELGRATFTALRAQAGDD